ncbi:GATA transcription factor 21 [Cardamine amara subsp. amara]|uniref:GATA transcription factor 21 n=1 Tax=Cardamine amara subsp. amara TaxID=228776 RepID=A0ABD1BJR7_CARAN
MGSNFHYSIDLNEDQNHHEQPFFYPLGSSSSLLHHHSQVPSNSSSSSSSVSSLSSYLPFLINSQEDQHVAAYNNTYHANHLHLSQPLKAKMFLANGGSSLSNDHMVPKKETRLKLTIRKKDHEDQSDPLHQNPTKPDTDSDKWMMSPKMRLIRKTITNNKQPIDHTNNINNHKENNQYPLNHKTGFEEDHDENLNLKKVSTRTTTATAITENRYNTINENGYGNNNGVIRACSDCNTTKTPLWRSGPRGPKSLCNACGIRQRKARRAAMAAAAAAGVQEVAVAARLQQLPLKKKLQNKKKRSNGGEKYNLSPPVVAKAKKCKIKEDKEEEVEPEISKSTTSSNSSISSNKLCFDDLTIMLSKSSAYQQVFPQDEKEAAILLMALSYGMVHG